jgi:hypothetical protein
VFYAAEGRGPSVSNATNRIESNGIVSQFHSIPSHCIPFRSLYCTSFSAFHLNQPHHITSHPVPSHSITPIKHTRENRSSDVIARSPPGQSRGEGRPPTATTKRLEVTTWTFPWNQIAYSWGRDIECDVRRCQVIWWSKERCRW